ncbi:MAG: cytochrome ubiquinol oxidase subunit I, partial [Calditrichota bacterium]
FGWDKVKPGVHFLSTVMVAFGAHFSAVWIIVANSWMQTPAGYHIVQQGGRVRAEVTNFTELVFNPSTLDRLSHTLLGAWQAGAWLVISVGAYYLLKKRHQDFARASLRIALPVALAAALLQLVTGDSSANTAAEHQPAKLAAMEGHYEASAPADMFLFGWVNEREERVQFGIALPGMLSWLLTGDRRAPVTGLRAFPPEDRPPVNITFQAYHLMVALGMFLIGLSAVGVWLVYTKRFSPLRSLLWIMVFAVIAPQIANQTGWITAEVGRQPWIVYGLMRTAEGLSPSVKAGQIVLSLIGFSLVYILLLALFVYLLDRKIKRGPDEAIETGREERL